MSKYTLICLFGYFAAILSSGNSVALPESSDANVKADETPSKRTASESNFLQFTANVKEIESNAAQCVELPESLLSTVTWKISICKTKKASDTDVEKLKVSMATSKWSFETQGNIKLLRKEGSQDKPQEIDLKGSFDSLTPSRDYEIVEWKDLDGYKNGDLLTFEINLSISSLKRRVATTKATTKFYVKVPDVRSTANQFSPEIPFAGIKWKVLTKKINENLAVYLYAVDEDMSLDEEWDVSYTFKLLSHDEKTAPKVAEKKNFKFSWKAPAYGYGNFISWNDLNDANKKFLEGNAALLQVELTLNSYT